MIDAYLAGAESMYCGCIPATTKSEARNWFEENHQLFQETEKKKENKRGES